VPQTTTAHGP